MLRALAHQGRPMALKDLAAAAGMAAAKAHPYLVSFGKVGLVEQDRASGRYGLGPLALQLGLMSLQQADPVRLATPVIEDLALQTGHTVAMAVWGSHGPTIRSVAAGPPCRPAGERPARRRDVIETGAQQALEVDHAALGYAQEVPGPSDVACFQHESTADAGVSPHGRAGLTLTLGVRPGRRMICVKPWPWARACAPAGLRQPGPAPPAPACARARCRHR